jgi:hypothetical protein
LLRRGLESPGERSKVEQELMAPPGGSSTPGYLGYCSIRPISSIPIGRTVLARLPEDDGAKRHIWATNSHSIHLGHLKLQVEGLPFQQQDAAVGTCGTAALWSAMVRVAREDGMRAPTPAEISEAALRGSHSRGRSIMHVNRGLDSVELCDAIRAFGFSPEFIKVDRRPEFFVATLHTYLQSGIPVVLSLAGDQEGHAVTAVGFQLSNSENPALMSSVELRSARLVKLYIHDDRLGPYARAHLRPISSYLGDELELEIEWDGDGTVETRKIRSAVAPVYPKVRLSIRDLLTLAELVGDQVERIVGPADAVKLRVDFRYEKGGDFLSSLSGQVFLTADSTAFIRRVSLSRWCAIIRWYLGEDQLLEFVYDTTDVVRDSQIGNRELLRALICRSDSHRDSISSLANVLGVPFL